jgi:hypothetical protein
MGRIWFIKKENLEWKRQRQQNLENPQDE